MVSKTPIGPANCKPHVVGCCPKLSVYPPHRLPTSSAIASIPLGSRESSREDGVERHQEKRAVAGLYLPNHSVRFF